MFFILFQFCLLGSSKLIESDDDGNYHVRYNHTTDKITWLVLGDWGGLPKPLYTSPIQLSVAESMKRTAKYYRPDYLLALGDNFYYWGVESVTDPTWKYTFENVYNSKELECPWHPTTGNHDWDARKWNGRGGNWTAQIEYSSKSERWTFPDLFYTIDSTLPNGMKQRIIIIDTPALTG